MKIMTEQEGNKEVLMKTIWDTLHNGEPIGYFGYDSRIIPGQWIKILPFEQRVLQEMMVKIFNLKNIRCSAENKSVFQWQSHVGVMHIGFYDEYICVGKIANLKYKNGGMI